MIHFYTWSEIHFTIWAWTFSKKVTKERLELKTSYLIRQLLTKWSSKTETSYLIRQLLTKWSSKTYCNVHKEDWGWLLLLTALESVLKKNSFHTRKKFLFSMTTRVRSRLAYPEDSPFPICFWFFEIAQGTGKRSYEDIKE